MNGKIKTKSKLKKALGLIKPVKISNKETLPASLFHTLYL